MEGPLQSYQNVLLYHNDAHGRDCSYLKIHIIKAFVLHAVQRLAIVKAAEYRLGFAALLLAAPARHINIIRAFVLHAVRRLAIAKAAEYMLGVTALLLTAPARHIHVLRALLLSLRFKTKTKT